MGTSPLSPAILASLRAIFIYFSSNALSLTISSKGIPIFKGF
jgi:hypothetical protein